MKKVGNKRSRARGHTKTICPRTMYRQKAKPDENKGFDPNIFLISLSETWAKFSSLFTIVMLMKMVFGL